MTTVVLCTILDIHLPAVVVWYAPTTLERSTAQVCIFLDVGFGPGFLGWWLEDRGWSHVRTVNVNLLHRISLVSPLPKTHARIGWTTLRLSNTDQIGRRESGQTRKKHGGTPQCAEEQRRLEGARCSVQRLALSMLTGRQPVYKGRGEKSIKEILLQSIPNWITAVIWRWEGWGGVIFFDEWGCSKCKQKMYIHTGRPPGLASHNFAHIFLFVPRASS